MVDRWMDGKVCRCLPFFLFRVGEGHCQCFHVTLGIDPKEEGVERREVQ